MSGMPLLQWMWFVYHIIFAALTLWTAILFFKPRSAARWCLLAGGVILALGRLTGSCIFWLGPFIGLDRNFDTTSPSRVAADIAWQVSLWGSLAYLAGLWLVLRKKDESPRRIAELEAALQQGHPYPPPDAPEP